MVAKFPTIFHELREHLLMLSLSYLYGTNEADFPERPHCALILPGALHIIFPTLHGFSASPSPALAARKHCFRLSGTGFE